MKVLVTGGAGYIGSHACKALAGEGFTPVTIDSLDRGHEWAVQWGPLYKANILETDKVAEIIRKEKVEAVMHFAALAYVGESHQQPLKYYHNNVAGSMSLFEAMKRENVSKLVFSSTCATYGTPQTLPIVEEAPQNPINPYGRTKLMVERILQDYVKPFSFSSISLRYFNASGADRELNIGEDHSPETHLIPLALRAAQENGKKMTIFGTDYETSDGTCIRDYIHVTDLANAHVLSLKKLGEPGFECFNLGTGQGSSVKEVLSRVSEITGKEINITNGPRRPGDPPVLVASGEKARKMLGWQPVHSDLSNIISTAHSWHEKHFGKR